MKSKIVDRENYIDIAKGICIIFVIIGHLNNLFDYESLIMTMIYSFHMPLFILLSGYLFLYNNEISWKCYITRRFSKIIKPYFVFSLITFIFVYPTNEQIARNWITGIFIANGSDGHLDFNIALWFLPMLFCCNIIFYFSVKISKYFKNVILSLTILVIISILLTSLGYMLLLSGKRFYWNIETALISQIFMIIGYLLKLLVSKNVFARIKIQYKILITLLLIFIWWNGVKINGRIDMNAGLYKNFYIFVITAISGIFVILIISKVIERIFVVNSIFIVIGSSSLYIMAYHLPASYLLYNTFINIMPNIIKENIWKCNIISISYIVIGAICISLFMKLLHKLPMNCK